MVQSIPGIVFIFCLVFYSSRFFFPTSNIEKKMNILNPENVLTIADMNAYRFYVLEQSSKRECLDFLTYVEMHYKKEGVYYVASNANEKEKMKYNKIQIFEKFNEQKK